ncbi:hypothetical protein [Actinoplanes derwentensis]|nr:hypothetical protein [Actinoplanes derwentensis]
MADLDGEFSATPDPPGPALLDLTRARSIARSPCCWRAPEKENHG